MLDNIISSYFSKNLFNYLDEKTKLKLIKYNKNIQNQLNISVIDYALYSEKYIIYESKDKGKEYRCDNDELIFEGEYLNGKRNGKGKEYDHDGGIKYEGEYLNGKRNGKGKEYSLEEVYEGEYKNGERNGKGKEYSYGKLSFEGEYKCNKKWEGKGYDQDGEVIYELKNGKGKIEGYLGFSRKGNLGFEC